MSAAAEAVPPHINAGAPLFVMRVSAPMMKCAASEGDASAPLPTGLVIEPAAACGARLLAGAPTVACGGCGARVHAGCGGGAGSSLLTCTFCGATITADVAAAAAPAIAGAVGPPAHSLHVHCGGADGGIGGGGGAEPDGLHLFLLDANASRAQMAQIANAVDAAVHQLGPVRRC